MGNQGSKSINLSDKEDNEDLDFAVKLLKTGSNPNELNSSGKSYLRIALEKGNWQLFKFFYEIGCKIIPVLDNETPLHYAVRNSHNDLVRFFLRNSSLFPNYKNSKDSEGRTSLHIAAMQGNPELVALLLKYNSDKDVKDKYGKTCKDLAIDNNCSDLEEILELLGSEEVIVCSPCTIKDIKSPHKRRVSSRSTYYSSVADTESKFDYLESVLRDSRIPVIPSQELKLGEVISRGSSCVVYKGIWRGTEVAIKQFKLEYSTSPKETNKFIKEMQVLSQTRHPNLILLMGVCIDQPNLCIISELVLNNSLFQALHKSHRSMSLETRFKISIQIAQGLVYLHQNLPPIIHRDLKPENCLLDECFNVKIADFGLARPITAFTGEEVQTTVCIGTTRFMAPELFDSKKSKTIGVEVDIWAFGCVMIEVFSNKRPWNHISSSNVNCIYYELFNKKPIPVPLSILDSVRNLIESCCSYNPLDRPSASLVLENLITARDAYTNT